MPQPPWIVVACLLAGASVAEAQAPATPPAVRGADDAPVEPRGERWDLYGDARLRFDAHAPLVVDAEGTTSARRYWASSRLLVGASFALRPDLAIDLELEAFTGGFAGQFTDLGSVATATPFAVSRRAADELLWVLPRKASLTVDKPTGRFSVGVQSFAWGSGLLANSGKGDRLFGDAWQGNVVARIGGAATPWRPQQDAGAARGLAFFGAVDFVLRDDNAFVYRGDLAFSGVGGVRLASERGTVGLLVSARYQRDRPDPGHPRRPWLFVVPVDAHARWRLGDGPVTVQLQGELAGVFGRTTRSYGEETAGGSDVLTHAALARVRVDVDPARLTGQLEVGYASGDADPRDKTSRAFTMNSDHNVGLVLFDHVLPLVAARSADRVADPSVSGRVAAGLRHAIPQGGVTNAVYLHPTVRWRPVSTLDLRLGYLLALAPTAPVELWSTAVGGGWSAPLGDGPLYGQEVVGAAHYTVELPARLGLRFGVEGGVLLPGSALSTLSLGPVGLVRGRFDLQF